VGGAIAYAAGPELWHLGGFTFNGLHLLFVISTVGRLASLWWLRRIRYTPANSH